MSRFHSMEISFKDQVVLYSPEDTELIQKYHWYIHKNRHYYVVRSKRTLDADDVKFHRCVAQRMGLNIQGMEVDHINGNTLDNRRENLRVATRSQNSINRGNQVNNKSGYKGVSWFKGTKRWRARIKVQGKQFHLGFYLDPVEAAKAYDKAALKYFGAFAWLNFTIEDQQR